jgi:predicted O-linked N-acetylglucosamine transferase (SPINDLY family)
MNETLLQSAVRLHQSGNLAEAARIYGVILRTAPRHFQALYLLGFTHFQEGRFEDAARLMGEAVKINPQSPDAFYNQGCALQALQRHEEALAAYDRAVALKADYDEAWINRGVTLLALKRHADAVASFDKALTLKPSDPEALSNRGTALFELKRYDEAAADHARLLATSPDFPYALGNLVLCRAYACDWRNFAEDRTRLSAALRGGRAVISAHASTLVSADAEEQLSSARRWVADHCPPSPTPLWRGERYHHDKIRVAYLSADFHNHATAFLFAGAVEHHDRDRFETIAISFGPDDGREMRKRLGRSFGRFVDVTRQSHHEVAVMMRRLEVDIAVDLKGHTQDARPQVLALKPAPVQVNYLGHPGTMGADYIDYILADETVIPRGEERFYSEKIVYLPDSYQANDSARVVTAPPRRTDAALPDTGFVFCSFNSSYKITPDVFDIWMRLLGAVEGSMLWLLDDNTPAARNLRREAEARRIDPKRLIFAPRAPPDKHLARQQLADLFLDTLPCNAHTTASDALWAGLPVLTCIGQTFAGRVAASLLNAVGLPEMVTKSLADYEALALRLARDPVVLAAVKAKLAENRTTHALFDTARVTRALESAFATMYERSRQGLPPQSFTVARVD